MKRISNKRIRLLVFVLISCLLFLGTLNTSQSQGLPDLSGGLPDLLSPLPDPAEVLGVQGEIYKENYNYNGKLYNTYLYPKPADKKGFVNQYTSLLRDAGYNVSQLKIEGYDAIKITAQPGNDSAALVLYDYQGYLFFMVPPEMKFQGNSSVKMVVNIGDEINFGMYEQDNNNKNGAEPIQWKVLAIEDGKALLVSKYVLDIKPYNDVSKNITWEDSSLRLWLNKDFYWNAFSSSEAKQIAQTTIPNPNNPESGTYGGTVTTDKIFLLSFYEASRYFNSDNERKGAVTDAVKFNPVYNEIMNQNDFYGYSIWWLRTPGRNEDMAMFVDEVGALYHYGVTYMGRWVNEDYVGVRPALWMDL